jgi:nucleoid DNA-binding protein
MKTKELIDSVAEKAGLDKKQATAAFEAVVASVLEAASKKEEVELGKLGKIKIIHKAAGTARNPATGAEIATPAKDVPKFTAGKALKDAALGA